MDIQNILRLPLQLINEVPLNGQVEDIYIGDLLSVVMASGKEGVLWLTVQKHLNVQAPT